MTFDKAVDHIMSLEGGYVDHAVDKGGRTKYGITEARYPDEDIEGLTKDRAKMLYLEDFWLKYSINDLPDLYRLLIMDMYVNHSPRGVALIVQRSINSKAGRDVLSVDGIFGEKTKRALMSYRPELFRIMAFRVDYYHRIIKNDPSQKVFYVGWINRCLKLYSEIYELDETRLS